MSIELLNCDCMEYMATQPDNAFDLCITSPPYNLGQTHHTGNNRHTPYCDDLPEKDYQNSQITMLNELFRVMNKDSSVFYNHKNRIRKGAQITPYEWLLKTKWTIKQEIVWVNGSQNFDKIRFFPKTERIYWLVKTKETVCENKAGLNDYMPYGVWPSVGVSEGHSRAFPLKLVEDILHMFPSTKKMIDPYLGSGTSAIAAHYFGCDFVGMEIDEDYFKAAKARFDAETAQRAMF